MTMYMSYVRQEWQVTKRKCKWSFKVDNVPKYNMIENAQIYCSLVLQKKGYLKIGTVQNHHGTYTGLVITDKGRDALWETKKIEKPNRAF